jgi:hypothetical protein
VSRRSTRPPASPPAARRARPRWVRALDFAAALAVALLLPPGR